MSQDCLENVPEVAKPNIPKFDYLFVFAVWALSFISFQFADDEFSYDYAGYILFFQNTLELGIGGLIERTQSLGVYPFPFLFVPPGGILEVGFVGLSALALEITSSPEAAYSLIAASSIALRIGLTRLLGAPRWLALFANIYTITLLEANALRLGCACTVLVFGIYEIHCRKRVLRGVVAMLLSLILHVQALAYLVLFVPCYLGYRFLAYGRHRLAILSAFLIVAPPLGVRLLTEVSLYKVSAYKEGASDAGGFTITSVLALLALSLGLFRYLLASGEQYRVKVVEPEARLQLVLVLCALPCLAVLIFVPTLAVIGVRLWQLAFCILCALAYRTGRPNLGGLYLSVLALCLVVSTVNVTLRYPLSNFFYPLLPLMEPVEVQQP